MQQLTILKLKRTDVVSTQIRNALILRENNWDDFSYKTTFSLSLHDESGQHYDIGEVKIGHMDQQPGWTWHALPTASEHGLPEGFFSLGQSAEYYSKIAHAIPPKYVKPLLTAMRDIVADELLLTHAKQTQVFQKSLIRFTSLSSIEQQFRRIIQGGIALASFNFVFYRPSSPDLSAVQLSFSVKPDSRPPTNLHVLIGRNGVGKTTILNEMAQAAVTTRPLESTSAGRFFALSEHQPAPQPIDRSSNYFSSVTSISFSAFDPFDPPVEQPDKSKGTCYFYVGLKSNVSLKINGIDQALKAPTELRKEFIKSLRNCFSLSTKKEQWLRSIQLLESDPNFAAMELSLLARLADNAVEGRAERAFSLMSSGHAVVLLSITRLVETVDEKSLVLIDEPESHLHPPLLAAFARALSEILKTKNGIAIIATHSPVILQEVPRSCAWKLRRSRLEFVAEQPEIETFGENVGILTREVFGLEVSKSGYHALLAEAVRHGHTFEEVMASFGNSIGLEGQTLLRTLTSKQGR